LVNRTENVADPQIRRTETLSDREILGVLGGGDAFHANQSGLVQKTGSLSQSIVFFLGGSWDTVRARCGRQLGLASLRA
jgi:hypothetical protein